MRIAICFWGVNEANTYPFAVYKFTLYTYSVIFTATLHSVTQYYRFYLVYELEHEFGFSSIFPDWWNTSLWGERGGGSKKSI